MVCGRIPIVHSGDGVSAGASSLGDLIASELIELNFKGVNNVPSNKAMGLVLLFVQVALVFSGLADSLVLTIDHFPGVT